MLRSAKKIITGQSRSSIVNCQLSNVKCSQNGLTTLEMLIAMALIVLSISSVVPLVSGSQSTSVDTQTNQEALYKARDLLESARASTYDSVTTTSPETQDIYQTQTVVDLASVTQCGKNVQGVTTWTIDNRSLNVAVTTRIRDMETAISIGGDCDITPPSGGWTLPTTLGSIDLGPGQEATGIDVINKIVFISAEASVATGPDFFIVDATDGTNPIVLSSINTGPGLNAIDVSRDLTTGKIYAYVANNEISMQLQIIDVDSVNNYASPVVVGQANLAPAPLGTDSEGKSIFYHDKKVYIGTHYLPTIPPNPPRPEFHIFDVSDPTIPFELGSYDVNHNINQIIVKGDYAYIATSDDAGEVWIIDISDSAIPTFISKFNATGAEDGESIYLVGNTLYLGRDQAPSSRSDFYILDISNPGIIGVLGSKNLFMAPSTAKVNSIHVSGKFAFLGTSDSNEEFQVLNIINPASIPSPIGTYNFPASATGIDFENNIIYSSVRSNDALRIIRPAECSDMLDDDGDGKVDIVDPQCHTDGNAENGASYDPEDDDEG